MWFLPTRPTIFPTCVITNLLVLHPGYVAQTLVDEACRLGLVAILSHDPSPNSPLHMPESIETEDSFRPGGLEF